MIRSKATNVLRSLNPEELKQAGLFVKSPYFNKKKSIILLYENLKPFYPDFNNVKCTKESLYKKIYGKKSYNDKVMRNLLSELYSILEEFIICQSVKQPQNREIVLFDKLVDFDHIFLKKYEETMQAINEGKHTNHNFTKKIYLLRSKIRYYLDRNQQHKISFDVLHRGENQIFEFLSKLDEILLNIRVNEKSYNIDYGIKIADEFLKQFNYTAFINSIEGRHPEYETIRFNYYLFMMIYAQYPENIKYSRLAKEHITINHNKYTHNFLLDFCYSMDNFYETMKRDGKGEDILYDQFELYKFQEETGLLIYDFMDHMRVDLFKIIFLTALQVNETKWAEKFVEENIKYIKPELTDYVLNFCRINLNFHIKNYTDSLNACNKFIPSDANDKACMKIIQMKIFYELKYTEQFISLSESFRKFLSNDRALYQGKKQSYRMFNSFAAKLMNIKLKPDYIEELHILKKEIMRYSEKEFLTDNKWLLDKINELTD